MIENRIFIITVLPFSCRVLGSLARSQQSLQESFPAWEGSLHQPKPLIAPLDQGQNPPPHKSNLPDNPETPTMCKSRHRKTQLKYQIGTGDF